VRFPTIFTAYLSDIQLFMLNIINRAESYLSRSFFITGLSNTATKSFQSMR
jgi:hypothetical protein